MAPCWKWVVAVVAAPPALWLLARNGWLLLLAAEAAYSMVVLLWAWLLHVVT